MKPIEFKQSVKVLQKPQGMTNEECQPLPVWTNGKECVSCWRAGILERLRILVTGKIWMGVYTGTSTQPPVFVSGEPVFEETPVVNNIRYAIEEIKDFVSLSFHKACDIMHESDKRQHVIAGFVISVILGILCSWWVGFMVGAFAGVCKEWWDSKGHGTVDVMDFVCTVIGSACAIPVSIFIHNLIW